MEKRIGMVATRLAGTDGVSLESWKWSAVLERMGHQCFYFAGESDRPSDRSRIVPEAHFDNPDIRSVHETLFSGARRSADSTERVLALRGRIKEALHAFIKDFEIEILIVENALSIPMNVPLGLAIVEVVIESGIDVIAHHHDFSWERGRYDIHAAHDFLATAFPPQIPSIHHVVINSEAACELARRTGMRSTVIPNVMDFANPPVPEDDYADDLRATLGFKDGEAFLLQPTRIVPRKRIERAVELARWIEKPDKLVVTHNWGDEGDEYKRYIEEYARAMDVELLIRPELFGWDRGQTEDGDKIYALADAYRRCDLVTYPSRIEGFGNAFLEAIYFRRPLMISSYDVFKYDIKPKGFKVCAFDEFIDEDVVRQATRIVNNPESVRDDVEANFELGRRYYSFEVLQRRLEAVLEQGAV